MILHEKILNYCFEDDGVCRRLKLNTELIDCSNFTDEDLQEQLDQLFQNLIIRVESGKEICYDAYANCLMDIYYSMKLAPKPVHLFQYATTVLQLESSIPIDLISISLIRCLILLMEYEEIEADYWYHLYENGPSQLKHVFACGFIKSVGFDEDFYSEVCSEVNYRQLFPIMYESKIIPDIVSVEDMKIINASLPGNIQAKIIRETQTVPTFKTVVYN